MVATARTTTACLLTPQGRAAVASIAVRGPSALEAVDLHFHAAAGKRLDAYPLGRIVFGRWEHATGDTEQLVVCRRNSEEVEIHCHGGNAAAESILEQLERAGCQIVTWPLLLCERSRDSIEAEAHIAITAARTERTAAILLDQLRGALRAAIDRVIEQMALQQWDAALSILHELKDRRAFGFHLTTSWQVVLCGRPNAGKSSLINALLGYERAIVYDQPGTTRDVLTAHTAIDGWPVELADTAGLRETDDMLEAASHRSARGRLERADLVLLVFDASQARTDEDAALSAAWPGALVVHTKTDLVQGEMEQSLVGIPTSIVLQTGLEELLAEVAGRLIPAPPPSGSAVPFTRRQIDHIERSITALRAVRPQQALAELKRLLNGPIENV